MGRVHEFQHRSRRGRPSDSRAAGATSRRRCPPRNALPGPSPSPSHRERRNQRPTPTPANDATRHNRGGQPAVGNAHHRQLAPCGRATCHTPFRSDAVTFSYGGLGQPRFGLSPNEVSALAGALAPDLTRGPVALPDSERRWIPDNPALRAAFPGRPKTTCPPGQPPFPVDPAAAKRRAGTSSQPTTTHDTPHPFPVVPAAAKRRAGTSSQPTTTYGTPHACQPRRRAPRHNAAHEPATTHDCAAPAGFPSQKGARDLPAASHGREQCCPPCLQSTTKPDVFRQSRSRVQSPNGRPTRAPLQPRAPPNRQGRPRALAGTPNALQSLSVGA